ncbi:MAG: AraC family transcriptional regulator [Ignavibacteriales bacterium]|nr:AraC family transcriptional regulator [Ignavibacteriales bacterium]
MEIIIHHSISDLYKYLDLPFEQEMDFSIHFKPAILNQIPFESPMFREGYFAISFIKKGLGFYTIDGNRFPFKNRTIYFTNPGHIKSFEIQELSDAYMITFSENFLRENVHPEIFDEFPFLLAEIVPPKILPGEKFDEFEALYKQINTEFGKQSIYKNKILGNLFTALLLKLKEEFWLDYNPIIEGNRNSQIIKSFKKLLESEFGKVLDRPQSGSKLQAQYFAEKMNLHPNYLNSVIKTKTGKSLNEWIVSRTLSAAKALLKNSALSVKEIAYQLGFSEPTHFNRFFKKHQNATPNSYRKSIFL